MTYILGILCYFGAAANSITDGPTNTTLLLMMAGMLPGWADGFTAYLKSRKN